jgi:hypothetical protein
MEILQTMSNNLVDDMTITSTGSSFIEANTIHMTLEEIQTKHIVPVFTKDNETAISHFDFIQGAFDVVHSHYSGMQIIEPQIRVSHPIKGRIPDARNKAAKELLEHEKTIFYERMAFLIEVPEISKEINGNKLSLVVGGVKAYNEDNLSAKKGTLEHFKIFIGFQNKVCLNLCVWTDGLKLDVKVNSLDELIRLIHELIRGFQAEAYLQALSEFSKLYITEHQFAQIVGKAKLYQFLSQVDKKEIPQLMFGDYQLSTIAKDYYGSTSFCRDEKGNINLWNLYNLFTSANKNSYIDRYLERGLNASEFVSGIGNAIVKGSPHWFLD